MTNFNETFREDVTYDDIKSHKKPGFHPLFRRYNFRETTRGVKLLLGAILLLPIPPVPVTIFAK